MSLVDADTYITQQHVKTLQAQVATLQAHVAALQADVQRLWQAVLPLEPQPPADADEDAPAA